MIEKSKKWLKISHFSEEKWLSLILGADANAAGAARYWLGRMAYHGRCGRFPLLYVKGVQTPYLFSHEETGYLSLLQSLVPEDRAPPEDADAIRSWARRVAPEALGIYARHLAGQRAREIERLLEERLRIQLDPQRELHASEGALRSIDVLINSADRARRCAESAARLARRGSMPARGGRNA